MRIGLSMRSDHLASARYALIVHVSVLMCAVGGGDGMGESEDAEERTKKRRSCPQSCVVLSCA